MLRINFKLTDGLDTWKFTIDDKIVEVTCKPEEFEDFKRICRVLGSWVSLNYPKREMDQWTCPFCGVKLPANFPDKAFFFHNMGKCIWYDCDDCKHGTLATRSSSDECQLRAKGGECKNGSGYDPKVKMPPAVPHTTTPFDVVEEEQGIGEILACFMNLFEKTEPPAVPAPREIVTLPAASHDTGCRCEACKAMLHPQTVTVAPNEKKET